MRRDIDQPWGDLRQQRMEARTNRTPRYELLPGFSADDLPEEQVGNQSDVSPIVDSLRYGDFAHQSFNVGTGQTNAILSRTQTKRTYLLIENTHATNDLYVGFGQQPNARVGVTIAAGGNYIMDAVVPQNDVFLIGSAANTTGKITYCNQGYGQF